MTAWLLGGPLKGAAERWLASGDWGPWSQCEFAEVVQRDEVWRDDYNYEIGVLMVLERGDEAVGVEYAISEDDGRLLLYPGAKVVEVKKRWVRA